MGINETGIATTSLVSSAASLQDIGYCAKRRALNRLVNMDPENPKPLKYLVEVALKEDTEVGYVSEKTIPLKKWRPPRNCKIPLKWFACPPPRKSREYDVNDLLGWRTNFYRAFSRVDLQKMTEIAAQQPVEDVRMFCECFLLLTKACERGLVDVARLLVDSCGCHVEGVQNRDVPASWRPIQAALGDTDNNFTPLHVAVYWGRYELVKLLLARGASVTACDSEHKMTALMIAANQGQSDVVDILCQANSDIGVRDKVGEDALGLADVVCQEKRTTAESRPFRRTLEILRFYDSRCCACRAPAAQLFCPCGMERYCSHECQGKRWLEHKKRHNIMMKREQRPYCFTAVEAY
jgi:hypothetical protein